MRTCWIRGTQGSSSQAMIVGLQRKIHEAARSVQGLRMGTAKHLCGAHTYLRHRKHYNQPWPAPLQQDRRDQSYPCTESNTNTQTALAPHGTILTWMVVVIDPDMAWLQVGHPNLPLQVQDICFRLMAQLRGKGKWQFTYELLFLFLT